MKHEAKDVLNLGRDFMESRILLSGVELNVFTYLAETPMRAEALAKKIGAAVRPLSMLLDALSAIGLLLKKNDAYRTEPTLASSLADGTPDSILPMLRHSAHLWKHWSHLTEIVKGAKIPESAGENIAWSPDALKAFIGAMHVVGGPMATRIVEAVGSVGAKRLLDVGGGSGTYTIAFLKAAPALQATLFDRPEVIEMARERLGEAGMLDRVALIAGNFYHDEFPPRHDLALLSAIIHQNSSEENVDLFRKVFRALNPGGRVIIRDHVMDANRTHPKDGAIFAINMLVGTEGGGTYTLDEITGWLEAAGFTKVRRIREGEHMDQLVEATKP
jgi:SAM-dependent methyltransferase